MSFLISESRSQAYQESFVINVLNHKRNGFYVELGSAWAVKNSNTFLLESRYNWSGLSLEINEKRANCFNKIRKNKCICTDAITFNYLEYLQNNNFPRQIDYLQMDIHPAKDTLKALKKLPLDQYRFSVITYEHNGYIDNFHKKIQKESQEILKSYGYELVVENLILKEYNIPYEDWYVDPNFINFDQYKIFMSKNITNEDLFSNRLERLDE